MRMQARLIPERIGGDEGENDGEGDRAAGDRWIAADDAAEHGGALQTEPAQHGGALQAESAEGGSA